MLNLFNRKKGLYLLIFGHKWTKMNVFGIHVITRYCKRQKIMGAVKRSIFHYLSQSVSFTSATVEMSKNLGLYLSDWIVSGQQFSKYCLLMKDKRSFFCILERVLISAFSGTEWYCTHFIVDGLNKKKLYNCIWESQMSQLKCYSLYLTTDISLSQLFAEVFCESCCFRPI